MDPGLHHDGADADLAAILGLDPAILEAGAAGRTRAHGAARVAALAALAAGAWAIAAPQTSEPPPPRAVRQVAEAPRTELQAMTVQRPPAGEEAGAPAPTAPATVVAPVRDVAEETERAPMSRPQPIQVAQAGPAPAPTARASAAEDAADEAVTRPPAPAAPPQAAPAPDPKSLRLVRIETIDALRALRQR